MSLDLDEIEQRLTHLDSDEYNQGVPKNAPWRAHASCSGRDRWVIYQPTGSDQSRVITEGLRQPFADFIAHARQDVPALVAEVRRLRREVEGLQSDADWNAQAAADQRRLGDMLRAEDERDAAVAEAGRVREALQAVRELHRPVTDMPGSLVSWQYCSCGSTETFTASDGYLSSGPARYPCPTVRALDAALDGAE